MKPTVYGLVLWHDRKTVVKADKEAKRDDDRLERVFGP